MRHADRFRGRHGPSDRHRHENSLGQSMVEFAIFVPILLLVALIGLDFARVYLGWVNLQNMARVAASYAANNATAAWGNAADPTVVQYRNQVNGDARATNCTIWNPITKVAAPPPAPTFADTNGDGSSTGIGDTATVTLDCGFSLVTPIISNILGNNLAVSASSTFPVRAGLTATSSSGGGGGSPIQPTAAFSATPTATTVNGVVQFNDESGGAPTGWTWDFGDGATSTAQDPSHVYTTTGTFDITLTVTNDAGSSTLTKTSYILVGTPAGAAFTGTPTSGDSPLQVTFTDQSTGSPTTWLWDFGDGTTSNVQNPPPKTYTSATARTYDVTLTVTNALGPSTLKKTAYISVTIKTCTVPDFSNTSSTTAQTTWAARGFTTNVNFQQGGLPWTIKSQTIVGNSVVPCTSNITVSKN